MWVVEGEADGKEEVKTGLRVGQISLEKAELGQGGTTEETFPQRFPQSGELQCGSANARCT